VNVKTGTWDENQPSLYAASGRTGYVDKCDCQKQMEVLFGLIVRILG
jgi:hypothetical protein